MRLLQAPTEQSIKLETSRLASDVLAGSNVTLTLENNDGFSNQAYIVVGYEGSELCEMCQVNQSVTPGQGVRVASLKFNHLAGEPVTIYRFNQRKFYGSASEAGPYSEITADGSPKDIQVDDPQGTVLEYTGTDYAWFKATYFNSTTSVETDLADSNATEGDDSGRYISIWAIRKHAGLANNPLYPDSQIEEKRKQAENEINSLIMNRYVLPLTEVPALIGRLCQLLAAGYIDYEEFGKDGEGVKWLAEARAILKQINTAQQRLIGSDGRELALNEKVEALSGYPDSSNDVGLSGGPMFGIEQRF